VCAERSAEPTSDEPTSDEDAADNDVDSVEAVAFSAR